MPVGTAGNVHAAEEQINLLLSTGNFTKACGAILELYGNELYGFFLRALLSRERAEDLYQDLAVALLKSLAKFARRCSVRTWTYKIARRLISRWRRRYSRRNTRLNTDQERELENAVADEPPDASFQDATTKALSQLSVFDREVLILRTEREFGYAEIGEVLGVSEETAKKRFQRARKRMQQLVGAI